MTLESETGNADRAEPEPSEHSVETDHSCELEPTLLFAAVADHIRNRSENGEVVSYSFFLTPPFSACGDVLKKALRRFVGRGNYQDIAVLEGDKDYYYYSSSALAFRDANNLVVLLEQDACKVIAEAVRFESEFYPCPYKQKMLTRPPYCFTANEVETALAEMAQQPKYRDIQTIADSNGEPYLFSNRFLSEDKAKVLCELFEAERDNVL